MNVILRQIDTEKLFTWHFVGRRVNGLDSQSHSGERRSADSAHSVERTEEEENQKKGLAIQFQGDPKPCHCESISRQTILYPSIVPSSGFTEARDSEVLHSK